MSVRTGLEVLRDDKFHALRGLRVGLMTNPSAVDRYLTSTYRIFAGAKEVNLCALFGPEHGFAGAAPDAEKIDSAVDARTGVPVYSLYGQNYRPTAEMMDGLDVLVCDIQDIGVRYYTFTWTISHILEAAGEHGVAVMILDRPNPLGGEIIAGPPLDTTLRSFVGRFPVPVRHGLTMGELARMINAEWNPTPCTLTVIPCDGWQRDMLWEETGLPWVIPSPNMPRLETVHQYPGACLIEGTQLSEGRGTALPFEITGAPWIDGVTLADYLNAENQPGVRFRPLTFLPHTSKFAGTYCQGVQVHVTDRHQWQPIVTWLRLIAAVRTLYPQDFAWLPPYQSGVEPSVQHFDRLIGSTEVRQRVDAGQLLDDLYSHWGVFCAKFDRQRQPYLQQEYMNDQMEHC